MEKHPVRSSARLTPGLTLTCSQRLTDGANEDFTSPSKAVSGKSYFFLGASSVPSSSFFFIVMPATLFKPFTMRSASWREASGVKMSAPSEMRWLSKGAAIQRESPKSL